MNDSAPAVALLFDDTELGGQLRAALLERGAKIVHEGGVTSLSRDLLQRVGADVLVINLDDSADDALDQLYDVVDGDRPRVVFNDAQASRTLVGWDRARWARHLAVKVLAAGDVDPPRPDDAREVDAPAPVPEELASPAMAAVQTSAPVAGLPETEATATGFDEESDPDFLVHVDANQHEHHVAESENLAAELEALLASGDLPENDDQDGPGLRYVGGVEPPPLHDGNFGGPEPAPFVESSQTKATPGPESITAAAEHQLHVPTAASMMQPDIQLDHLQLSALTDADVVTIPPAAAEPGSKEAVASVSAPTGWALLDDDVAAAVPAPAAAEKSGAAAFGIEKMSAADFLAPDVESVAPDLEPVMSLELVSMEEAVAPQAYIPANEMLLDDLGSALSRIVVLGAAANGTESVSAFLAALPASTRTTFLLVQHLGTRATVDTATQLAEYCALHCPLTVRVAEQGTIARVGEVLVAPAGNEVKIRRNGEVDLLSIDSGEQSPSIDASFTAAASVFGRDALAIVFLGQSTDAVAGAQAIHDRGGQVWVESSSGEHFSDMVSGIFAERLVSFSGTPPELAAHLIEVFS